MGWPRGSHHSMETKAKMREAHLGKHLSDEHKAKISKSELGKHLSIETKQKLREARLGKHLSEETKAKISKANLGKHPSEETKAKISKANLGKHHSDETKSKMSKAQKKLWQDPQFAKRSFEAFNKTLNKPEKMLMEILDSNFQGEWKFVGDGQFFLAGLCPDFISINGKKKIIEIWEDELQDKDMVLDKIERFMGVR